MDKINAPYNFIPLSDKIVIPEWAEQVSHDIPFKDGLSGEITFTLTAHSPLLVGVKQQSTNQNSPDEVNFFQTPDGKQAIPGSSLRGMIRSVLEILTFSHFRMVDDKRYGLRDISGKHVALSYTTRVRNHVKAGFLRLGAKGEPEIVPCEIAKISQRDLKKWWSLDQEKSLYDKGSKVEEKYQRWGKLSKDNGLPNALEVKINVKEGKVTEINHGHTIAYPVFTGQISVDQWKYGELDKPGKHNDFMFYDIKENDSFKLADIDPAAWRDFLFIHGDDAKNHENMPWPNYWKGKFWKGQQVPVFYIQEPRRLQIGLAYMPKLAGDFSIHDMIGHTNPDHLENKPDFASLIFGNIGEKPEEGLKGRVFIEPATADGTYQTTAQQPTILSSPKPSYFPNYIKQDTSPPSHDKLSGGQQAQYATYVKTQDHYQQELRGWKRYPTRPDDEVKVQEIQDTQARNKSIQVKLHTIAKDSTFTGRLVFHNLKPEELGALCWAMSFGNNVQCRHSLGMGKPFGFGQVSLIVKGGKIKPNLKSAETQNLSLQSCMESFERYMGEKLGCAWRNTEQVKALLALCNPNNRKGYAGKLEHMRLDPRPNEFVEAKQSGLVLAKYISKI